jgi:TfoX/Sxy family transcriptional regulator of competence genes
MSGNRADAEHVIDLLGPGCGIGLRRFFGGWSLTRNGRQIAIMMDTLYVKVDPAGRARWRDAGSHPFSYRVNNRTVLVEAYWSVPDDALDEPELLRTLLASGSAPVPSWTAAHEADVHERSRGSGLVDHAEDGRRGRLQGDGGVCPR